MLHMRRGLRIFLGLKIHYKGGLGVIFLFSSVELEGKPTPKFLNNLCKPGMCQDREGF